MMSTSHPPIKLFQSPRQFEVPNLSPFCCKLETSITCRRSVDRSWHAWCAGGCGSVTFVGQVGAEVLARLDGVAASTGSACHAGRIELSPVLKAMGVAPEAGMGAIRFSLGRGTTAEEIDGVADRLARIRAAAV